VARRGDLESIALPSVHDGQRAPGLRFGDLRTMALLGSIAALAHVIGGLTNKTLRPPMNRHLENGLPLGPGRL
jgi:hypothetical protein